LRPGPKSTPRTMWALPPRGPGTFPLPRHPPSNPLSPCASMPPPLPCHTFPPSPPDPRLPPPSPQSVGVCVCLVFLSVCPHRTLFFNHPFPPLSPLRCTQDGLCLTGCLGCDVGQHARDADGCSGPLRPVARPAPQDGRTPLFAASAAGYSEVVARLIAAGAAVNAAVEVTSRPRHDTCACSPRDHCATMCKSTCLLPPCSSCSGCTRHTRCISREATRHCPRQHDAQPSSTGRVRVLRSVAVCWCSAVFTHHKACTL
jgi:hypothetical protein